MKKLTFLLVILLISISCGSRAQFNPMQTAADDVALDGFDPVSYFADGAAKGSPQHEFVWNGVKWLFSNSENLREFKENPGKFTPEFGGYCAFSIAEGKVVRSDPTIYKVVDGKLYFWNNLDAKAKWEANQAQMTESGMKNWERLIVNNDFGTSARVVNYGLILVAVYLIVGVIFAFYFVGFEIGKFDSGAQNAGIFFRLIIFPGAVIFWWLLLIQILRKGKADVAAADES